MSKDDNASQLSFPTATAVADNFSPNGPTTRLKEAEESLFRKAVIERAAEGLCVCREIAEHPYVQFTVWNARMTEITGYTMEEVNRRGWYQTVYHDPAVQAKARDRTETHAGRGSSARGALGDRPR